LRKIVILEVAAEHARLGLLGQSYSSRRFPATWSPAPKRCTRAPRSQDSGKILAHLELQKRRLMRQLANVELRKATILRQLADVELNKRKILRKLGRTPSRWNLISFLSRCSWWAGLGWSFHPGPFLLGLGARVSR